MALEFVTVRNKNLSIWQSVVDEVSRRPDMDPATGSLMRKAAGVHAQAAVKGVSLPSMTADPLSLEHQAFLSKVYFEHADALRRAGVTTSDAWKYSNGDIWGWATCEIEYQAHYPFAWSLPDYHNWTTDGKGSLDYGIIPYTLPNDARVLIIGDWGTGQNDAATLLKMSLKQLNPTAVIHLGDVYYSGTRLEARKHVVDVFANAFKELNMAPIPVFTMCGNHDYYAGGGGFYETIAEINKAVQPGSTKYLQQASYFCLRSADHSWQFLAMDTGYDDHNPANDALSDFTHGPNLHPNEATWHRDKLDKFPGYTILLSHHQLFSSNALINGKLTGKLANVNKYLMEIFEPYFYTIGAWIWGHEHNFAAYENGTLDLAMGRLLGNSAYEETVGDGPYTINYPDIPYASNLKKVGTSPYGTNPNSYYNHSVALIDFKRAKPSDALKIAYFQYPSWPYESPPADAPASLAFLYDEPIPPPPPVLEWSLTSEVVVSGGERPRTNDGAALAVYSNRLYMAYKGTSSTLYLAWLDGSTWKGNERIKIGKDAIDSNHAPALTVYNNKLYMIYKHPNFNKLYAAWFDGSTWQGGDQIMMSKKDYPETKKGPAAATFGNLLYVAYRAKDDEHVRYCWYDGNKWTDRAVNTTKTGITPSLAVYDGGGSPVLYLAYSNKEKSDEIIISRLSTPGTGSWVGLNGINVPGNGVPATPYGAGLAQVGDTLVMFYAGRSHHVYWAKMDGSGTWTGNLRLEDTTPISPKSDEKIGLTSYGNAPFMTYRKEGSKEIWQARMTWEQKKLPGAAV